MSPAEYSELVANHCNIDLSSAVADTSIEFVSRDEMRGFVADATRSDRQSDLVALVGALGITELSAAEAEAASTAVGFYEPQANRIVVLEDIPAPARDRTIAHELVHAWRRPEQLAIAGMAPAETPDAYVAALGFEEGLAEACATTVEDAMAPEQRDELAQWRTTYSMEVSAADFLERRWSGWTYRLGLEFVRSLEPGAEAQPGHFDVAGAAAGEPVSTAQMLGYAHSPRGELGALLFREALVASGVSARNADALAASLTTAELTRVDDSTCWQLSLTVEPTTRRPGELSWPDATGLWVAAAGPRDVTLTASSLTGTYCSA